MTPQAKEIEVKQEKASSASTPPSATATAESRQPTVQNTSAAARGRDMFGMLRSEIDRLFDDFASPGLSWPRAFGLGQRAAGMPAQLFDLSLPAMDFVAKDDSYELRVDMPGLKPEEIEIRLDDGRLDIRGESSSKREEREGDYFLQERRSGRMERSITLPRGIDPDGIDAVLSDGVLTVTLPKTAEARENARRIDVKAQ